MLNDLFLEFRKTFPELTIQIDLGADLLKRRKIKIDPERSMTWLQIEMNKGGILC